MNEDFYSKIDEILTNVAFTVVAPISTAQFFATLIMVVVAGVILHAVYATALVTRRNDRRFAFLLALIMLVTCIIITFIKSSLVLSIGLIGALSIVRFRTPVKDGLDLGFLFAAIALGIGFGSGQSMFAFMSLAVFSLFVYGYSLLYSRNSSFADYAVQVRGVNVISDVEKMQELLVNSFGSVAISRIDKDTDSIEVFFQVCVVKRTDITDGIGALEKEFPSCDVRAFTMQV